MLMLSTTFSFIISQDILYVSVHIANTTHTVLILLNILFLNAYFTVMKGTSEDQTLMDHIHC